MKYISVEDAGKKFNLSARSIRNYCSQGRIPGAVLSGKTWLIPEDAQKPERINNKNDEDELEALKAASGLISFINDSPVASFAINNVRNLLINNHYREIKENELSNFKVGDQVFIIRNDTTLLALNIGKNVFSTNASFHIIASHADSPCFKLKPECDSKTDLFNKINVEPYGGMIASTWFDRPLSVAGRVILSNDESIETRLVNMPNLTVMIPNLCIHFNRDINKCYEYNMAIDLQPYLAQDSDTKFVDLLSKSLNVEKENIVNFDLYLYNKESGVIWGEKNEFISCPRLDDLECVYTSSQAFVQSENENSISILYITDNEEVGSRSRQGADSDFLRSTLKRVCSALNLEYEAAVANSFLVSADNAHAVHPNKPGVTDSDNKCYMNKGIAIKFNASNSYTSDAISSAIFQKICKNASVPYQFFTNRSDLRGGSTLGNLLLSQVSLMAVDVGLAQLAMHSSYETAGTYDVYYAIKAFKEFYSSNISINGNKYKVS